MTNPELMFATSTAIAAGALVQSCIGFGMALVAVPFLLMLEPRLVPIPLIMVSLLNCAWNWYRYRDEVALGSIVTALIGRVPGTVLAIATFKFATEKQISLLCAILVLIAVGISLRSGSIAIGKYSSFSAGAASGFMGTVSGIGGPPMALLYQNETADRARGTMGAFFTLGCIISLLGHLFAGTLHQDHFVDALAILPATFVGTYLARYIAPHVGGPGFKKIVLATCTAAAGFTVIKTLY
jgi:uncharacterized protein